MIAAGFDELLEVFLSSAFVAFLLAIDAQRNVYELQQQEAAVVVVGPVYRLQPERQRLQGSDLLVVVLVQQTNSHDDVLMLTEVLVGVTTPIVVARNKLTHELVQEEPGVRNLFLLTELWLLIVYPFLLRKQLLEVVISNFVIWSQTIVLDAELLVVPSYIIFSVAAYLAGKVKVVAGFDQFLAGFRHHMPCLCLQEGLDFSLQFVQQFSPCLCGPVLLWVVEVLPNLVQEFVPDSHRPLRVDASCVSVDDVPLLYFGKKSDRE